MEWLCLFRKLSPLYQAFQRPLSPPPSTSTAGNMPVTNMTNVSLAAGARPFPPEDPKRGPFWDPLGVLVCHSLTSSAEEPLMTKRSPLLTALMYGHCTVLGLGKPEDWGWWRWKKGDSCILSCRYQVRARLATELRQYFLEFLCVPLIKQCPDLPSVINCRGSELRGKWD